MNIENLTNSYTWLIIILIANILIGLSLYREPKNIDPIVIKLVGLSLLVEAAGILLEIIFKITK